MGVGNDPREPVPDWWYDPPDDYTADIGPEDVPEPDDDDDPGECEPPLGYGVIDDSDFL